MTNYYYSSSAYRSKFDPLKFFATADEAKAFDRGWAAQFIASRTYDDMTKALKDGDAGFKAVLEWLVDELPEPAPVEGAAETRCFR
jgi:hypothetical protein